MCAHCCDYGVWVGVHRLLFSNLGECIHGMSLRICHRSKNPISHGEISLHEFRMGVVARISVVVLRPRHIRFSTSRKRAKSRIAQKLSHATDMEESMSFAPASGT